MNTTLSRAAFAALVFIAAGSGVLFADSSQLASAKGLYAQASYEEALVQLNAIKDADVANQVDQYRALCLLALGREREARASLERLVVRAPLYVVKADEAPPKLMTLFQQVRAHTLPTAAKDMYAKARASYDAKRFADADTQFEEMLAILKEAASDDPNSPVADLKQLGEGFLRLTKAELAPKAPLAAPPSPAAAATAMAVPRVYSADDADVVPPVDLARALPAWSPPAALAQGTYKGALMVVIDESGRVERSAIVDPIAPPYDSKLLAASKTWKFQPATKNGVAVKYRKIISLTLRPTGE